MQWCGVVRIVLACFLDSIFRFQQFLADKFQSQFPLAVIDRHNIVSHFFKTFIESPLVKLRLDLDQIRAIQNFLLPGIRPACPVLTIIQLVSCQIIHPL